MAGVRKRPNRASGKYQGWFIDATGRRCFVTGTRNKAETLRIVQRLEDDHRQVRLGYRPAPTPAHQHAHRPFHEVKDEYLAWGKLQGGLRGHPWGEGHLVSRTAQLAWWQNMLTLETLGDLHTCLSSASTALQTLSQQGLSRRTVATYRDSLYTFCQWCVEREYLDANPLEKLGRLDDSPTVTRRALTADEIERLLHVAPAYRRMLYHVALCSGLRGNELRSLQASDLDIDRGGLMLHAAWTKNRREGFQPLPDWLIAALQRSVILGEPGTRYEECYDDATKIPTDPLLYVPTHLAREFARDCATAGISRMTGQGKVDFHALRLTYINAVLEAGATITELQSLARHRSIQITLQVYGRVRQDRPAALVEAVGNLIPQRATSVLQKMEEQKEGAMTQESAKGPQPIRLAPVKTSASTTSTNPQQNAAFPDDALPSNVLQFPIPPQKDAHAMHTQRATSVLRGLLREWLINTAEDELLEALEEDSA